MSRQKGIARPHLRDNELAAAMVLAQSGMSAAAIAKKLGRDQRTIKSALDDLGDTRAVAKAYLASRTLQLAQRVVEQADVDQAIDILSRSDVAVIAPVEKGNGNSGVQVMIGVVPPGLPGGERLCADAPVVRLTESTDEPSPR